MPDVHIYTSTKVPWITLPDGVEVFEEFYDVAKVWTKETNETRFEVLERILGVAILYTQLRQEDQKRLSQTINQRLSQAQTPAVENLSFLIWTCIKPGPGMLETARNIAMQDTDVEERVGQLMLCFMCRPATTPFLAPTLHQEYHVHKTLSG